MLAEELVVGQGALEVPVQVGARAGGQFARRVVGGADGVGILLRERVEEAVALVRLVGDTQRGFPQQVVRDVPLQAQVVDKLVVRRLVKVVQPCLIERVGDGARHVPVFQLLEVVAVLVGVHVVGLLGGVVGEGAVG